MNNICMLWVLILCQKSLRWVGHTYSHGKVSSRNAKNVKDKVEAVYPEALCRLSLTLPEVEELCCCHIHMYAIDHSKKCLKCFKISVNVCLTLPKESKFFLFGCTFRQNSSKFIILTITVYSCTMI